MMMNLSWPEVMWMIPVIPTIPGWRLWPSISTIQVARRCATKNLDNSFFYIFENFRLVSCLCRLGMMQEQSSGCLLMQRWLSSPRWNSISEMFPIFNCYHLIFQVILYASHKDFVEKVVEKLGAHWWTVDRSVDANSFVFMNTINWK